MMTAVNGAFPDVLSGVVEVVLEVLGVVVDVVVVLDVPGGAGCAVVEVMTSETLADEAP